MFLGRNLGWWVLFGPIISVGASLALIPKKEIVPAVFIGGLIAGALGSIGIAIRERGRPPVWRYEQRTGREFHGRLKYSLMGLGLEVWGLLYLAGAAAMFRSEYLR